MSRPGHLHLLPLLLASLLARTSSRCPKQCSCRPDVADCTGSNLTSIPIVLDPRIHILHLQDNSINDLRNALEFYPILRRLDLTGNRLTSLGSGKFILQRELVWLKVCDNYVKKLSKNSLEGLTGLVELDLSKNKLTQLDYQVFRWMPLLRDLSLANNRIERLAKETFDGLEELKTLDLSQNRLKQIPSRAFTPLIHLQTLHLRDNQIENISSHAFFALQSIQSLTLAHNRLAYIHPKSFRELYYLNSLDVSHNSLREFPAEALALQRLHVLNVSGNLFTNLNARFLYSLKELRVLKLCHNTLMKTMSRHAFSNNLALEEVHVCNNKELSQFPAAAVASLRHLRVLNIANNTIAKLENMTDSVQRLTVFNISGNPLECNCSSLWLWRLYKQNSSAILSPVKCATSNKPISSLSESQLGCRWWLVSVIAGAFTALTLLCVTFAAMCAWRRKRRDRRRPITKHGARVRLGDSEQDHGCTGAARPILLPTSEKCQPHPIYSDQLPPFSGTFTVEGPRFGAHYSAAADKCGESGAGNTYPTHYENRQMMGSPSIIV